MDGGGVEGAGVAGVAGVWVWLRRDCASSMPGLTTDIESFREKYTERVGRSVGLG